jgi:Tfp pilus assembly PilM family ATPase
MVLGLNAKNLSPIGVDFGTHQLKLLQVTLDQPPRLAAAAACEVPADVRGHPAARAAFLTDALHELTRNAGCKGKRAIASIPTPLTFIQHVRLPRPDDPMVDVQVREELRGKLPIDPSHAVIRRVDLGRDDGATRAESICMVAGRQTVMHHLEFARKAGITIVGMYVEPVAILEAFAHLYRRAGDEKRTTFFIDIGAFNTRALIAHGKHLAFAKTIQVGAEHLDRQYAEDLGIDLEEAKARRRAVASQPLPDPARASAPDPAAGGQSGALGMAEAAMAAERRSAVKTAPAGATSPDGAHEAIRPGGEMLDCLIDELQLCLGYHGSLYSSRPIDKLVFIGGEARLVATCQMVARALRLPAQLGDPLARFTRDSNCNQPVGVDLRESQPAWAVPLGLCRLPSNL